MATEPKSAQHSDPSSSLLPFSGHFPVDPAYLGEQGSS